jgi:hypothetical protein
MTTGSHENEVQWRKVVVVVGVHCTLAGSRNTNILSEMRSNRRTAFNTYPSSLDYASLP